MINKSKTKTTTSTTSQKPSSFLKYQDYIHSHSSNKKHKYLSSNLRNTYVNTKSNNNEDEEYEYEELDNVSSKRDSRMFVSRSEVISKTSTDYYLDTELGDLPEYRNLLQILRTASEEDDIRIWIDGPGGYLHTALAIIDSMNSSKATVTVILTGRAFSAHSIIALAATNLVISDRARLMLHAGTYGVYGKENEVQSRIEAEKRELDSVVNEFYADFLTDEEIKLLKVGQDYWFDYEEIDSRLTKRNEIRQARYEKQVKEQQAKQASNPSCSGECKSCADCNDCDDCDDCEGCNDSCYDD